MRFSGVILILTGISFSIFFSCSARKSKPTQLRIHPVTWLADHPNVVLANNLQPEYGLACKSCHGEDYTGGTAGVSCVGCHSQRRDSTQRLIVCTGCHGGGTNPLDSTVDTTGAPPYSLAHDSLFSDRGVGGHPAMVNGSAFFAGTDCQTCHIKPAFVLSANHFTPTGSDADGRAEVIFSGPARTYASVYGEPVFDTTLFGGSCSNIYCHGAFPGGFTSNILFFYGGPSQVFCGSCHAAAPGDDFTRLLGKHKTHDSLAVPCITCHYATVDSSNIIRPASRRQKHVNGVFDVEFDPTVAPLGVFDGSSCSGLPDSPGCHANQRDW